MPINSTTPQTIVPFPAGFEFRVSVNPPGGIGHYAATIGHNPAEASHFSSFSDDPVGFIIEALVAAEPAWSELPGLAPLFLGLALSELEELGA